MLVDKSLLTVLSTNLTIGQPTLKPIYQCLGLDVSTTVAGTQQDSHLKIVVMQSVTGVKEGWSRCRWSAM